MKHMKLLLAAALGTAAWCSASQAQTVVYDAEYVAPPTVVYESTTPYYRDSIRQYQDYHGRWHSKSEPVAVIGTQRTYIYPEATVVSPRVIYSNPSDRAFSTIPGDSNFVPRY